MTEGRAEVDNGKNTFDFCFLTEPGQAEMDTSAVDCGADTQWHRALWRLVHPLLA